MRHWFCHIFAVLGFLLLSHGLGSAHCFLRLRERRRAELHAIHAALQCAYRYDLVRGRKSGCDSAEPDPKCNDNGRWDRPDSHRDTVALPFCHFQISFKFQPYNYPSKIETLGDHLLVRRLDKKLIQKDVAKIIGVNENTILDWEKKHTDPEVKYYPKIMDFMGCCPIHYAKSFGDLLLLYRTHKGLSHRQLAKKLKVDPGTISRWESGVRNPYKKHQNRINKFFGTESLPVKTSI